jgi:protein-S-isoprenylcysteine O-methyltransferase Ste14
MNFFDYFQIASLAGFLFILVGKILFLRLRKNINPIAIGGGKKGFRLAFELISFGGLLAWAIELLLYAFHARFHIFPAPLDMQPVTSPGVKLFGVILVSLGLAVFASAYFSFGDSWRVGFDTKTPGALVTNGIFSISRNPIYLFLDLWFIGIFLINGTLIFLIFAVLALAAMHFQIRQEEAFLTDLYGQSYQDYCSRTGRYLTLVRP